ncbi:hypothetical protein EW146_g4702 [Bondarzewia mesenterica]|uniref:UTP--glucose-1-phosphate uridylyltransferase n=1 Tax=Bondarzewia mesenterica TaxID=1095465 RepID=A0A4S4LUU6_9AGAM|nr:hypothetical protein EW146_g4702 [Bondarzewia mesenterica]
MVLKQIMDSEGMGLEIITNLKVNDDGLAIIQLETAAGTTIKHFHNAHGINVARSRFLPVKSCSDLLLIESDRSSSSTASPSPATSTLGATSRSEAWSLLAIASTDLRINTVVIADNVSLLQGGALVGPRGVVGLWGTYCTEKEALLGQGRGQAREMNWGDIFVRLYVYCGAGDEKDRGERTSREFRFRDSFDPAVLRGSKGRRAASLVSCLCRLRWMNVPLEILEFEMAMNAVDACRYSVFAVYTVSVYDWLISLEEEVELIHQARWTSVKVAYLFCRYYPLLLSPLHIWGWMYDHDFSICKRVITPLYICLIPLQISAQVVLMLRAYAFTGRRLAILVLLYVGLAAVLAVEIWVFTANLTQLFDLIGSSGCFPTTDVGNLSLKLKTAPKYGAVHLGLVFLVSFCFDLFSMSIIMIHCLWNRSTQGSLGRTFLKQGLAVFVAMSVLNIFSAGMYFRFVCVFHVRRSLFIMYGHRPSAAPIERETGWDRSSHFSCPTFW